MIFSLVQDYALAAMPVEHSRYRVLKLIDEASRRDVHFISDSKYPCISGNKMSSAGSTAIRLTVIAARPVTMHSLATLERELLWVIQLPLAFLRGCRARLRGGNRRPTVDDFVRRVWDGDYTKFRSFVESLRSSLPPGTPVYVAGSAATGRSFVTGEPFDARGVGRSDIDLVLGGPTARTLFRPDAVRHLGLTTFPLSREHPTIAPRLTVLRQLLVAETGRDVSFVVMRNIYRRILILVNGEQMLRIVD